MTKSSNPADLFESFIDFVGRNLHEGFGETDGPEDAPKAPESPSIDPHAEALRLLKQAEEAASTTDELVTVANGYLRVWDSTRFNF